MPMKKFRLSWLLIELLYDIWTSMVRQIQLDYYFLSPSCRHHVGIILQFNINWMFGCYNWSFTNIVEFVIWSLEITLLLIYFADRLFLGLRPALEQYGVKLLFFLVIIKNNMLGKNLF
jgi:hypothetical protein